jgi:hypothetical protein
MQMVWHDDVFNSFNIRMMLGNLLPVFIRDTTNLGKNNPFIFNTPKVGDPICGTNRHEIPTR